MGGTAEAETTGACWPTGLRVERTGAPAPEQALAGDGSTLIEPGGRR